MNEETRRQWLEVGLRKSRAKAAILSLRDCQQALGGPDYTDFADSVGCEVDLTNQSA